MEAVFKGNQLRPHLSNQRNLRKSVKLLGLRVVRQSRRKHDVGEDLPLRRSMAHADERLRGWCGNTVMDYDIPGNVTLFNEYREE